MSFDSVQRLLERKGYTPDEIPIVLFSANDVHSHSENYRENTATRRSIRAGGREPGDRPPTWYSRRKEMMVGHALNKKILDMARKAKLSPKELDVLGAGALFQPDYPADVESELKANASSGAPNKKHGLTKAKREELVNNILASRGLTGGSPEIYKKIKALEPRVRQYIKEGLPDSYGIQHGWVNKPATGVATIGGGVLGGLIGRRLTRKNKRGYMRKLGPVAGALAGGTLGGLAGYYGSKALDRRNNMNSMVNSMLYPHGRNKHPLIAEQGYLQALGAINYREAGKNKAPTQT
jgi:hypothetical protein